VAKLSFSKGSWCFFARAAGGIVGQGYPCGGLIFGGRLQPAASIALCSRRRRIIIAQIRNVIFPRNCREAQGTALRQNERKSELTRLPLAAVIGCVAALPAAMPAIAQSEALTDNDQISEEMENPVTRRITLPLRSQADFNEPPYGLTKDSFIINQAVVPFILDENWALITRTKLPWVAVPPKKLHESWADGLSNGYTTFFLSPKQGTGFFWGAGPVVYYPASNDTVGVRDWGSGPSVGFFEKDGSPWVYGAVVNNIWSFGSPVSSNRTNQMLLNPFFSYHFADGWSVGSSPSITANWIATGDKWTIPVGGGLSKSFRIGDQPVKLALDAFYNAIRPKADSDTWLLQATLTFSFPR
jgi:hypothetical protein